MWHDPLYPYDWPIAIVVIVLFTLYVIFFAGATP